MLGSVLQTTPSEFLPYSFWHEKLLSNNSIDKDLFSLLHVETLKLKIRPVVKEVHWDTEYASSSLVSFLKKRFRPKNAWSSPRFQGPLVSANHEDLTQTIPKDLWYLMMEYCSVEDLLALRMQSKKFREMVWHYMGTRFCRLDDPEVMFDGISIEPNSGLTPIEGGRLFIALHGVASKASRFNLLIRSVDERYKWVEEQMSNMNAYAERATEDARACGVALKEMEEMRGWKEEQEESEKEDETLFKMPTEGQLMREAAKEIEYLRYILAYDGRNLVQQQDALDRLKEKDEPDIPGKKSVEHVRTYGEVQKFSETCSSFLHRVESYVADLSRLECQVGQMMSQNVLDEVSQNMENVLRVTGYWATMRNMLEGMKETWLMWILQRERERQDIVTAYQKDHLSLVNSINGSVRVIESFRENPPQKKKVQRLLKQLQRAVDKYRQQFHDKLERAPMCEGIRQLSPVAQEDVKGICPVLIEQQEPWSFEKIGFRRGSIETDLGYKIERLPSGEIERKRKVRMKMM